MERAAVRRHHVVLDGRLRGVLFVGRFIDRVGVRLGFAAAVVVWSLAAAGHGLAGSVLGFAAARFALGLGESGNFPAAIKATAEWFPKHERAWAIIYLTQ